MNKLMEQVRSAARMPDKRESSMDYHLMRAEEMKTTAGQCDSIYATAYRVLSKMVDVFLSTIQGSY